MKARRWIFMEGQCARSENANCHCVRCWSDLEMRDGEMSVLLPVCLGRCASCGLIAT